MRSPRAGPCSGVVIPWKGWIEADRGCIEEWLRGMIAGAELRGGRYNSRSDGEGGGMSRSKVDRAFRAAALSPLNMCSHARRVENEKDVSRA